MNMQEYLKVKDMTYLEYCDYLQNKYGIGLDDYMTKSYNPKPKCKRTSEGLIAHHKKEDTMAMLSHKEVAMICPFEWQSKENIVYCDYLEHLLLHVLICKYPSANKLEIADVGIGGVVNFIVPELNDFYSGWETNQTWKKNCFDLIRSNKEVYLAILQQFLVIEKNNSDFSISLLLKSFNEPYGLWNDKNNKELYNEIISLNSQDSPVDIADAIVFPNGNIRCSNCEQMLSKNQRICPACKKTINRLIDINEVKQHSKSKESDFFKTISSIKTFLLAVCHFVLTVFKIIFFVILGGLTIILISVLINLLEGETKTNQIPNNTLHYETPVEQTTDHVLGYDYQITQLFFECDKDTKSEAQITSFLEENLIEYKNLHYTESGYYTMDLTGYTPASKESYKEEEQRLLGLYEEYPWTVNIKKFHVTGQYKAPSLQ